MFDYSRMEGRFFEPDDKICLIFDNVKYDKLRELPEFSKKKLDEYGEEYDEDYYDEDQLA